MPRGDSPRHIRRRKADRPKKVGGTGSPSDPVAEKGAAAAPGLGPVRLQKLLAAAGFGSRRDMEQFLEEERVTVNGRVATLGDRADPGVDDIRVDGERLQREKPAYWIVNKPRGVVTTVRDDEGRRTVIDLLPRNVGRLFPVGRLDRETSGLLLLTNDGDVTHALLHPSLGNEREYRVSVKGELDGRAVGRLERGVTLEEGQTSPARVGPVRFDSDTGTSTFTLTLMEGRKRQIRRSLLILGFPVRRLARVRMGPLRIGRLGVGEARPLRSEERRLLLEHVRKLRAGERPVPTTPPSGPTRRPPKGPRSAPAPRTKRSPRDAIPAAKRAASTGPKRGGASGPRAGRASAPTGSAPSGPKGAGRTGSTGRRGPAGAGPARPTGPKRSGPSGPRRAASSGPKGPKRAASSGPKGPKRAAPSGPKGTRSATPSGPTGARRAATGGPKGPGRAGSTGPRSARPSGPRSATGSAGPKRSARAQSEGRGAKRSAGKPGARKKAARKGVAKKRAVRKSAGKKKVGKRKPAARASGPRKAGGAKAGPARRQRPASSRKGTRR